MSRAVPLIALACAYSGAVHALEDCSEQLAAIDQRIAGSNAIETRVQVARQLRAALEQSCSVLDERTANEMVARLDQVLPPQQPPEQAQAERRTEASLDAAKREFQTLQEAIDAQAAAEQTAATRAPAVRSPASPATTAIVRAPPRARSLEAHVIDRAENMTRLSIWDADVLDDRARVLYATGPSLDQLGLPDWRQYVYAVEIARDGQATQHLVTSRQAQDHAALALRRGHDELIFERHVDRPGEAAALELWSIPGAKLLSAHPVPNPVWPDGERWAWGAFRLATRDGNVLYGSSKKTGADGQSMLAWFEAAPDGGIPGQGSSVRADASSVGDWFETSNGGGGLIVRVAENDDAGIASRITTPIERAIAGRRIHAVVAGEKRLLVTSDDERSAWESAALERELVWAGEMAIPHDLPAAQMLVQSQKQMQIMQAVANEYDANRTVNSLDVGLKRIEMIKPMHSGYAVLASVTADRDLDPPIHGPYLLVVGETGIDHQIYLNPLAEAIDVEFTLLAVSPRDEIYVLGSAAGGGDSAYVVRLNKNAEPDAYGRAFDERGSIEIQGMLADASGVWLFGHADASDGVVERIWTERIDFP
jgi:hypothetical protein